MYRERIKEQKKLLNLSAKAISERSELGLPEETVSRFLAKNHDSRISTMLDICKAVGLEPYELFMDSMTAAEFKLFLEAKASSTNTSEELKTMLEKNVSLQDEITALTAEIELLKLKLEHKDEIIRLHNRYNDYIDAIKK
jgi:transcriptional regulator with XRE-family HTH domain